MKSRPTLALGALCVLGLAVHLGYALRLPLVMDEFQGAASAWQLTTGVPYRDFSPYKPVLGYLLQLPWLVAFDRTWPALVAVKVETALLLALGWFWIGRRLLGVYSPRAVLAATALLFSASTWLERAADLRVDALAGMVGTIAVVAVLERRPWAAGLALGTALLVSQKAIVFLIAVGLAQAIESRRDAGPGIGGLLRLVTAVLAPPALYFGVFALLASPGAVIDGSVGTAARAAAIDLYDIRWQYWSQTLSRNPFFWGAAAVGLASLVPVALARDARDAETASRAAPMLAAVGILWAFSAWNPQPWPYFFPMVMPAMALPAVAVLDRFGGVRTATFRIAILLACLVQFAPRLPANLARDQTHQRQTVETLESLVRQGGTYLAGVDLVYRADQAPAELRWLDRPRLAAIDALPPSELHRLTRKLESAPSSAVVANYRLQLLPEPLRAVLARRFVPYRGNVWVERGSLPKAADPGVAARPLFEDVYDY